MKATTSARRFIKNSEWLDEFSPLAVSLVLIAQAMDAEDYVPASLATAFRLTMADIMKMKPAEEDTDDDVDGLFNA